MPTNLYLEIFGYIGTALVILSMLMTSVVKLRVFNTCGSVISMIYAFLGGALPIVLLNAALIVINVAQLIRMSRTRVTFHRVSTTLNDKSAQYFLTLYGEDIKKYFPDFTPPADKDREVHMAFLGGEAVGMTIGVREGSAMDLVLDYAAPKYRDLSVGTFLFSRFGEDGIETLRASTGVPEHEKYLLRMGFTREGDRLTKTLNRNA